MGIETKKGEVYITSLSKWLKGPDFPMGIETSSKIRTIPAYHRG